MDSVIEAFIGRWQEHLVDADRQMLAPYLEPVIDTADDDDHDETRGWYALDWLVRVHAPAWLELAGLPASAAELRALPKLRAASAAASALPSLEKVRDLVGACLDTSWDAAKDPAKDAAEKALGVAGLPAAMDVARTTTGGMRIVVAAASIARTASQIVAWQAGRAATVRADWTLSWEAATRSLAPTRTRLQHSALRLLEKMIDPTREPR